MLSQFTSGYFRLREVPCVSRIIRGTVRHRHAFAISKSMRAALLAWSSFARPVMLDDHTSVSLPKPLHDVVISTKKQKRCASPCSVRPTEFELAFPDIVTRRRHRRHGDDGSRNYRKQNRPNHHPVAGQHFHRSGNADRPRHGLAWLPLQCPRWS